jgi:hypothetical protein
MCKLANLFQQYFIGKRTAVLIRCIGLPDQCWLVAMCGDIPVQAVFRDIQFAAPEPFYFWFREIPFQYGIPFFSPAEIFCNRRPETSGVFNTLPVFFLVIFE